MKRMNIITVPGLNGGLTGWLKDKPGVVVQGDNHVEVVKNLIKAENFYTEVEEDLKKEKK